MVDRIAQGTTSRIPVPNTKASTCLLPNGTDIAITQSDDNENEAELTVGSNGHNGNHRDGNHTDDIRDGANDQPAPDSPIVSKVPKAIAPKELLIDKGNACIENNENSDGGFDTFLMTGDMMIKTNPKTNPSVKLQKADVCAMERHHSDSTSHDMNEEKPAFKRSASSPDQSTLLGANRISHENLTVDNLSKLSQALDSNLDDAFILRKESAESGFEEQAVHSDSGVSDRNKDKLTNDPTSVSDLSEVDSDDFLGNMVTSQCTTKCGNISTVSTPSDLRSDVSMNTVLQQEVEPLLNDDSSSSSSIDISTSGSCSDMSPEMIFERSLSDSGGMSPVYQKDVKSLLASKSAEKFVFQKQIKLVNVEHQNVRASKSQENYVGNDLTFINIDIDDMTYSLDQIPQPVDPTPTKEDVHLLSESDDPNQPQPNVDNVTSDNNGDNNSQVTSDLNDDRIFMPSFVKLNDSVDSADSVNDLGEEGDNDRVSGGSAQHTQKDLTDTNGDTVGSGVDETDTIDDPNVNLEVSGVPINQDDLFALPPAKRVDQPSAKRLAKRLYNLDGFRKSDVSRHLSKKNDFNTAVAEEYLKFFTFAGDTVDVALRKFLKQFSLIGETQERERVLAHFSRHYLESNAGSYNSEDACHTLVCAIMLLNSDLHGQAVSRKMSCNEFIENLAGLNEGSDFPKEVLKAVYHAIKAQPIEWAPDEEFEEIEHQLNSDQKAPHAPSTPNLSSLPPVIGRNPFLDVPDPSQTTEYKKGYIMRKCCVDPDGRKTAMGKRSWKMFYVVLRDMILYLYKDEQAMKKSASVGSHNAIRVHHCLTSKASDYGKKQHVFRLKTADWAEYLFQTSNTKECQEWIDTLNFVAGSLSAPPLPGAVGSQKKFQRPLLPATYTRLNLQDQYRSIEERLNQAEVDIQDHRQFPPEKGSKSSTIQCYIEKENYLLFEVTRLKTYLVLLQSRLSTQPELEPSLVETCIGEDEEGINLNNHAVIISPASPKHIANVQPKITANVQRSLSDRESSATGPATRETTLPDIYNSEGELVNLTSQMTRF